MHLMITFQQLELNLLMRYPLLLMVQVMLITLLAAKTNSFSVQLVVAIRLNKRISIKGCLVDLTSRSGP